MAPDQRWMSCGWREGAGALGWQGACWAGRMESGGGRGQALPLALVSCLQERVMARLPPEPEPKGLGAGGGRQITGSPAHVCLSWRPDPRHVPLAWGFFLICEMGA